jgi:hypothetical protein
VEGRRAVAVMAKKKSLLWLTMGPFYIDPVR